MNPSPGAGSHRFFFSDYYVRGVMLHFFLFCVADVQLPGYGRHLKPEIIHSTEMSETLLSGSKAFLSNSRKE
jgi:hypothetical protein